MIARLLMPLALLLGLAAPMAAAQKNYGPGVTDTEIKIGQTMAYSGPASVFSAIGRAEAAYFRMINDRGGVNGRRINLLSVDDGYSPPKTVEQTRMLVEQEGVLLMFNPLGTAPNSAIHKYLNGKGVPQLFVASGADKWADPERYPWTMGWLPSSQTEGRIYAKYILQNIPDAKVAVLYQNDDFGKDYVKGMKDEFGARAGELIVKEATYEITDPTIDSQILTLQASGANVFFNVTSPKFSAQAIRKAYDIGWRPTQFLVNTSFSIGSVLTPAGLEKSVGIISTQYLKDPMDPAWADDPAMREYLEFLKAYIPDANISDQNYVYGYLVAQTLVQVLEQCGDDLSRRNVMAQAANLKDLRLPMLLPGIAINTSPTNFRPITQEQLIRFDGKSWVRFGDLISGQ